MTICKNNTTVTAKGGETIVTLYQTAIVKSHADYVELNTGGWCTPTTQARMNQALGALGWSWMVRQEKKKWHAWNYKTDQRVPFVGNTCTLERSV